MPCSDPRDNPHHINGELRQELQHLTGIICALNNSIRMAVPDHYERILINAEIASGGLEIRKFLDKHADDDRQRLRNDLNQYSEDELRVLKRLIDDSLTQ